MTLPELIAIIKRSARFYLANPRLGPSFLMHMRIRSLVQSLPEGQRDLGSCLHGFYSTFDRCYCSYHMAARLLDVLSQLMVQIRESVDQEVQDVVPELLAIEEYIRLVLEREVPCDAHTYDIDALAEEFVAAFLKRFFGASHAPSRS